MPAPRQFALTGLLAAALGFQPAAAQTPTSTELAAETDPQRLLGAAVTAQQGGNLEAMEQAALQLVRQRPQIGAYGYLLAKSYALQDKKSEAYNVLLLLSNQGLTFDLTQDPDLENLRGYQLFDYLVENFEKNAGAQGEVSASVTLNGNGLLADGLAWDPKRRQFLVGSITQGGVFVVEENGALVPLVKATRDNGLQGVFDLAIDHSRRALWVASAGVPHYAGLRQDSLGYTGIFEFDLDSGEIRRRFDLPGRNAGNKLVNLAVAPDGSVFAANAARAEIFAIAAGTESMDRIFSAPKFTSIRGLAVSKDSATLYFSDYELGLFGIDLASREPFQVRANAQSNLGGIDSLARHEDALIAVQNGNSPHRALRIDLDDTGRSVAATQALLVNHPAFLAPNEGIVARGQFHLIANSNAPLYDNRSGQVQAAAQLKPQTILSLDAAAQAQDFNELRQAL
ncbi:MAG: hypothetical protein AAGA23_01310 [Pseudomonadota bacterium]